MFSEICLDTFVLVNKLTEQPLVMSANKAVYSAAKKVFEEDKGSWPNYKHNDINYIATCPLDKNKPPVNSVGGSIKEKRVAYEKRTLKELVELCKKRKIKYSGLKKAEIIARLRS